MNDSRYLTIRVSESTYSKLKVIGAITNTPMTTLFASMIETPVFQECLDLVYEGVLKGKDLFKNDTNNDK